MKINKHIIYKHLYRKNIKKQPEKVGKELLVENTFNDFLEWACFLLTKVYGDPFDKTFNEFTGVERYWSQVIDDEISDLWAT